MGCYREVQLDEKWAFVSQKEKSCDPLDPLDRLRGDDWDHTAVDPESRLRLALVPGKRDGDACKDLVQQVHNRTAGRTDLLITSDEHAPYETAIKEVYSVERPRPKRPGPGRPPKPERILPADLCYATVRKAREGACGGGGADAGLRRDAPAGGLPVAIAGQHQRQHVVRRAAQRDGSAPELPEASQDLWLLQGHRGPPRRIVLHRVQL